MALVVTSRKRPDRILNVSDRIKEGVNNGNYFVTTHAFIRQDERIIGLPVILHILKTGYEEKKKTRFDIEHNTWKYAIRGKTIRDE